MIILMVTLFGLMIEELSCEGTSCSLNLRDVPIECMYQREGEDCEMDRRSSAGDSRTSIWRGLWWLLSKVVQWLWDPDY